MDDLIEALTIFRKYSDTRYPTNCVHDELWVCVDPEQVSDADKKRLDYLGFLESDYGFVSYRFGSC